MPRLHREYHFSAGNLVRDIVIGMSDGLTVPFALAAGLSGAISVNRLIVLAGMAEIAAGSIAMGLGGYLAARGDAEEHPPHATLAKLSYQPVGPDGLRIVRLQFPGQR